MFAEFALISPLPFTPNNDISEVLSVEVLLITDNVDMIILLLP